MFTTLCILLNSGSPFVWFSVRTARCRERTSAKETTRGGLASLSLDSADWMRNSSIVTVTLCYKLQDLFFLPSLLLCCPSPSPPLRASSFRFFGRFFTVLLLAPVSPEDHPVRPRFDNRRLCGQAHGRLSNPRDGKTLLQRYR